MTYRHPVTTPLAERMAKHTAGQITWPEPALRKWCDGCRHFYTADTKTLGKGRCDLVKCHSNGKTNGVAFVGSEAMACPQFEAGEHHLNKKEQK